MNLPIESLPNYRQLLAKIDVPLITEFIPLSVIKNIIQKCHVKEKRLRALPAWLMVLLCILRGLFAQEALASVFARLCFVPCLQSGFKLSKLPDKSALCLARYRLGARPLALLFKQVCRPISTPQTPSAFAFGLRLVAIDSTKETVADTPANENYFGRHRTKSGRDDGAFPLFQSLYLCECSTHIIFDAVIAPFKMDHHRYFRRLLRSVDAGMLVMFDRGFIGYDSIKAIHDAQAQALAPARKDMKLRPQKYLSDGSYITYLRSWTKTAAPAIAVRVITYTIDDPQRNPYQLSFRLITTLLDPDLYPAEALILLYHQRWEIELAIDEIDTHQRLTWTPFRSQKPVGVIQEFYALLLAYFIIRSLMYRSAETLGESPQCLSFVNSLRLIQHVIPVVQLLWDSYHNRIVELFHQWQQYFHLPPRDNRINPRVIKRNRVKFRRKRAGDHSVKVLPFAEVVRLL